MRIGLIAAVVFLAGCVSNSQPGSYNSNFDRQEAAKTRMSLGLTYLKNNNYKQAKVNLDQALEYDPRSAEVNYAIAYYYQLVGDVKRADDLYQTAMSLAPYNGDIANSYGAFKCQDGDYEGAKEYFLKAVSNQQYANSAETYENLALCAQSQGNVDDAITYFQSALKHQPLRAKSLYLLTELYIATEQWTSAKYTLDKYQRVAKPSPDSLWLSFEIHQGTNDWEGAKEVGYKLSTLFPDSPYSAEYKNILAQHTPQVERKVKGEDTNADTVSNSAHAKTESKTGLSSQQAQFHIVKANENLYRISLKHNIKITSLKEWNNIENAGSIFAGMKLWLVPQHMQGE